MTALMDESIGTTFSALSGLTSPLAETFARLAETNPYQTAHAGRPTGGEWWSMAELLAPASPSFATRWAAIGAYYETDIPEVLVRFFGGGIVYTVASAAVGAFTRDRQVPNLDPENCWLSFAEWGSPNAIAFADDRFTCLPNDPAARSPKADVVSTIDELREELREQLIALFTPLVTALRARAKVGARTLWRGAAESCAHAVIGSVPPGNPDDDAWLLREVDALVASGDSLLRAETDIAVVEANGRRRLCLIGATCCENFKRPNEGYCGNCPHRSRAERITALEAWVGSLPA